MLLSSNRPFVVDGASEADTTLMAAGAGRQITVLDRTPLPHSLGQFYAAMTAFLGFVRIMMSTSSWGWRLYAYRRLRPCFGDRSCGCFLRDGLVEYQIVWIFISRGPVSSWREFVDCSAHLDVRPTRSHSDIGILRPARKWSWETLLHLGRHLRSL